MHNFNTQPELSNAQMQFYYLDSPHQQITKGFMGEVTKVTDGDTIHVATDFRDFDTVVRFANINAPEMSEGGKESKIWLEEKIMGEEVYVKVNPNNRVGKWGRIIGEIFNDGMNINNLSLQEGQSRLFTDVPYNLDKILARVIK